MSFAWPWLFLALPLPWLLRALLAPAPAGTALRMPSLPEAAITNRPRPTARMVLAAVAWLLLLTAAARPQLPADAPPEAGRARGMILAFDVSMSMATADLQQAGKAVERIGAALALADAFLARLDGGRGDRMGLVVFGAQAYLHTPVTYDLHAVRAALGSVQAGFAGQETALGDAIALAVKYLMRLPQEHRVLVLLTDGASTAGTLTPERAAWLAQRNGVTIHAAGIGASSGVDEATLRSVAAQTGGSYTRATDSAALAAFFARLDDTVPLPKEGGERPLRELYAWPLAMAFLLALALGWRRPRQARA